MRSRIAQALALMAALWLAAAAGPGAAQGLFSPVIKINDSVVTQFELDQRKRMLELFRFPGDITTEATLRLIEERLQLAEAQRLGIGATEAELVAGETEFAARANLEREEFLTILGQFGVAPESYRDFVRAGVLWRKVVQALFGPGRTVIGEDDIDRGLGQASLDGGTRVLLTEILMPAGTPATLAIAETRAARLQQIETPEDFSAAAARFSAGPSRTVGGELDWIDVAQLPGPVGAAVARTEVGAVTAPIRTEETLLLFYLRDRRQVPETTAATQTIDYATLLIDGGRTPEGLAIGAEVAGAAATCDDLYPIARDYPQDYLTRQTQTVGEIPSDIALELAKLDPGEQSLALTRNGGQSLLFVMLCERLRNPEAEIVRPRVADALFNQQLGGKARIYLNDLRANATVEIF